MADNHQYQLTCKLTTPGLQKRRATVIAELKSLLTGKEGIQNGYKYAFKSDDAVLNKLIDFIKSERLCCDFFDFALYVRKDSAILKVSGPAGSKEFLDHEVQL